MPLYKYTCSDCGTKTEKLASISREFIWCPKCGEAAKRVFCADGGIFKIKGYSEKNGYS